MSDDMTLYRAFLQARYTSEALLTAHSKTDPDSVEFYRNDAYVHLVELASELGFDLVKRVTATEAAALATVEKEAA